MHNDVRKGITNAQFNEDNSNILFFEIMILAAIAGIATESWWVFGGTFLGLTASLFIKPLAIVIIVLLSLAWGLAGYGIGTLFETIEASIVLAILGFVIGLGVHLSALEWAQDVG